MDIWNFPASEPEGNPFKDSATYEPTPTIYGPTPEQLLRSQILNEQANGQFKVNDFEEAEQLYTQAILLHASNPVYYSKRALARLKLSNWKGVERDSQTAKEIYLQKVAKKELGELGPSFFLHVDRLERLARHEQMVQKQKQADLTRPARVVKDPSSAETCLSRQKEVFEAASILVASCQHPQREVAAFPASEDFPVVEQLPSSTEEDVPPITGTSTEGNLPIVKQKAKRPRRVWKRKEELPMIIEGWSIATFPDSGSEENIMRADIAGKLGLEVDESTEHRKEFRIANGSVIRALGTTLAGCVFPKEEESPFQCRFYIFEACINPVIMGIPFLEATETLTKFKSRLCQSLVPEERMVQCCALSTKTTPKRRICCRADGVLTSANADTGSEVDLISLSFLDRISFRLENEMTKLEEGEDQIQFVDGSTAKLEGMIDIQFHPGNDSDAAWWSSVPANLGTTHTFYVLKDLTCGMLLSKDTLDELNAFETYRKSFEIENSEELPDVNTIVWLAKVKDLFSRKSKVGKASGPKQAFEEQMEERDARENHRREKARDNMTRLSGEQKQTAEKEEEEKIRAYEEGKELLHRAQARLAGQPRISLPSRDHAV